MTLTAKDIMTRKVVTVAPQMHLLEVEQKLRTAKIGGAPVVDDGRLVGMISRSDVARQLNVEDTYAEYAVDMLEGPETTPQDFSEAVGTRVEKRLRSTSVHDAMLTAVDTVRPGTSVREVAGEMLGTRHRRLVVITDDRTILGIVTTSDLVRLIADGRLVERQGDDANSHS